MSFTFEKLEIQGLVIIAPKVFKDSRGSFIETYKRSEFALNGISNHFVQDNHSKSSHKVLRGLHYQLNPAAQGKLVKCISGVVYDVAVDIRKGSPSYGKWIGVELSEENRMMFYIPAGFAHGLVVLSGEAQVLYKCTSEYSLEHERGIIWCDPELNIAWPVSNPILSPKDTGYPLFRDAENNFEFI